MTTPAGITSARSNETSLCHERTMRSDHFLPGCIRTSLLVVAIIALGAAAACDEGSGSGSRSDASGNLGQSSSGGPNEPGPDGAGGASSSSGSSGSPDGGGDPGTPAVPYVDFAVNHVLITGQSNSVANSGTPVLSTAQPFSNVMFDTGVMPMKQCDGAGCRAFDPPSSFVPLVEGDFFFGYGVETSAAGVANEITLLAKQRYQGVVQGLPADRDHSVLVSLHGRSGNTYWCLRKGGCNYKPGYVSPFEQGMMEVEAAKNIAAAANKSYVVRAVAAIHGESDHYSYTEGSQEFPIAGSDGTPGQVQTYADGLIEWQADYETGIKAITGQTLPVPLFISQISGWNDTQYSKVAQFQLEAHERAPGKVVLVGPSYQLPTDQNDCRHFTNHGQRRLGEYFAKVYARVVFEGKSWEPLRPKAVTRDGAAITVTFHVPAPPLVIDTQRVAEVASYGFTYTDGSGAPPAITSVDVTGPDTVKITLASPPTGAQKRLLYAQNQVPLTCIGTPFGARGNLRDSDASPSQYGYDLHNWAVNFDVAVP